MEYLHFEDLDETDDTDREWTPRWLHESRGLIDKRAEQEEFFNDILDLHLPAIVSDWRREDSTWLFQFEGELMIRVNDQDVVATSSCIARNPLDQLRTDLRSIPRQIDHADSRKTELAVYLLKLGEEAAAMLETWRETTNRPQYTWNNTSLHEQADARKPWKPLTVYSEKLKEQREKSKVRNVSIVWNPSDAEAENSFGLELSTARDTATFLLGRSIEDICLDIPDWLRVLHVEPVFRIDLAQAFLARQKIMSDQLSGLTHAQLRQSVSHDKIPFNSSQDTIENLTREITKPHVTFHGSPRSNTRSIIRYGFLKPGSRIGNTGASVPMRMGSSYGIGVYSSPDPMFAWSYSQGPRGEDLTPESVIRPEDMPGRQLFVCATLMGRAIQTSRDAARRKAKLVDKFAHSHVSPDELQYIVFDETQILPCYILHLDYTADKVKHEIAKIVKNPRAYFDIRKKAPRSQRATSRTEVLFPGEVKAKKEAMKAAARKWFPYGYGPMKGDNFVIEEIGHVSDDEEDYGDYQDLRKEEKGEVRRVDLSGRSWFDEYQTVRKMKRELVPSK